MAPVVTALQLGYGVLSRIANVDPAQRVVRKSRTDASSNFSRR